MTHTPWNCARGDASTAEISVADTVNIAPDDDSVDTNSITLVGLGNIRSFGLCSNRITKTIRFLPQGGNIKLINSLALNILGKKDRTISHEGYGTYICHGDSNWIEFYFTDAGTYITAEEYNDLEARVSALEIQVQELIKNAG
jgi:hypothetical protein